MCARVQTNFQNKQAGSIAKSSYCTAKKKCSWRVCYWCQYVWNCTKVWNSSDRKHSARSRRFKEVWAGWQGWSNNAKSTEEREIALTCMTLGDTGFGLTKNLVEVVLFEHIKAANSKPILQRIGIPWSERFLRRWPCLSECKPQHLRAEASHPEVINGWFDRVEELVATHWSFALIQMRTSARND